MSFINRRIITGTHYFISFGAAVNYYWQLEPDATMAYMVEVVNTKVEEGAIVIACPIPTGNHVEYYALSKKEGRYFHISEPVFGRSKGRSLASQL